MSAKYKHSSFPTSCSHCTDGRSIGAAESPDHWMICRAYLELRQGRPRAGPERSPKIPQGCHREEKGVGEEPEDRAQQQQQQSIAMKDDETLEPYSGCIAPQECLIDSHGSSRICVRGGKKTVPTYLTCNLMILSVLHDAIYSLTIDTKYTYIHTSTMKPLSGESTYGMAQADWAQGSFCFKNIKLYFFITDC